MHRRDPGDCLAFFDRPLIRGGAPDEGEEDLGGAGAAGAGDPGADESPVDFELDLEAPPADGPSSAAPAEPAARRPAAAPAAAPAARPDADAAWAARLQAQQRETEQLRAAVDPILRQQREAAERPPVDPARIDAGEATPQEFRLYTEWLHNRQLRELALTAENAGRRASSESYARGVLTAAACGAGRDYDSFRARYVDPIYQTNPHVRELVAVAVPQSPALGEYYLGVLNYLSERFQGDLPRAFQAIFAAVDNGADGGRSRGGKEVVDAITTAAKRGADKILSGRQGAPSTGGKRKVTSQTLWDASDEDFARFARSQGADV